MLSFVRSVWFVFSVVAVSTVLGLYLPSERLWLFGMAATAAFWGLVDWIGTNGEDSRNVR